MAKMVHGRDMVGAVISTDKHGNVEIVEYREHEWGGKINFYLDKYHMDTCIGSMRAFPGDSGGSMRVVRTDKPATVFPDASPASGKIPGLKSALRRKLTSSPGEALFGSTADVLDEEG